MTSWEVNAGLVALHQHTATPNPHETPCQDALPSHHVVVEWKQATHNCYRAGGIMPHLIPCMGMASLPPPLAVWSTHAACARRVQSAVRRPRDITWLNWN